MSRFSGTRLWSEWLKYCSLHDLHVLCLVDWRTRKLVVPFLDKQAMRVIAQHNWQREKIAWDIKQTILPSDLPEQPESALERMQWMVVNGKVSISWNLESCKTMGIRQTETGAYTFLKTRTSHLQAIQKELDSKRRQVMKQHKYIERKCYIKRSKIGCAVGMAGVGACVLGPLLLILASPVIFTRCLSGLPQFCARQRRRVRQMHARQMRVPTSRQRYHWEQQVQERNRAYQLLQQTRGRQITSPPISKCYVQHDMHVGGVGLLFGRAITPFSLQKLGSSLEQQLDLAFCCSGSKVRGK